MSTDVLWRWRNILVCTLWPVFYQAVGGDGGKDKNKEGKVEEVVFMLTCWLEGKGFMWSVVKSNAIAQDPTSTACIPLVFSFSAPIVSPLFSFSFYLLLSLLWLIWNPKRYALFHLFYAYTFFNLLYNMSLNSLFSILGMNAVQVSVRANGCVWLFFNLPYIIISFK